METTETTETTETGIEAFLKPETETEETDAPPVEATEEPEAEDVEQPADDAEAVEIEASDEDDTDDATDEPAPELYTVKVDGKETKVTLDELQRSYSGQSYIQKGMKEAADAKRQAEQLFQTLQAEQQQLLQFAQQAQQQGIIPPPQAPDPSLAQRDPNAYVQALAWFNQEQAAYQQQQEQLGQMTRQQQAAREAAMAAHLKEQAEALVQRIPDLADPEKAPAYKAKLMRYGVENGFSEEELGSVDDARAVTILDKAMRYDALQKAKAQAVKPGAPRTVKPSARASEPQQLKRGKLIAKAKSTGNPDDWVAAFME